MVERVSRRLASARHYGYAHFKPNPPLPKSCPPRKVTTKTKGLNTFPLAGMTPYLPLIPFMPFVLVTCWEISFQQCICRPDSPFRSPMSLSFSHHGSSRRGPSSNPRPQPWRLAPVSRDASHPSTYDSMSQPPWQGLNTHSGPFDDLGSTSSLTLNPPSAPLVPGDYNYLYAAASEDSGRAGLGLE